MPDMLEEFTRESIEQLLKELPVAKRLQGLPAEELLARLSPEQRLQGLSPEQLLSRLSPEEIENYLKKRKATQDPDVTP